MKKNIALFVLSSFTLLSCSEHNSKKGNVIIEGEIAGLKQGTLYLQQLKDNELHTLDSIVIKGESKFNTAFDLPESEMIYLTLNRGTTQSLDNSITFFAEPGTIKITSSLDKFYSDAKVEGSQTQTIYNKYLSSKKRITDRKVELIKDQLLAAKNNQIVKADSLQKQLYSIEKHLYLNAANFSLKNNNSVASAYITLTDVLPVSDRYVDSLYNNFTPDVKSNKYGQYIHEYLESVKNTSK